MADRKQQLNEWQLSTVGKLFALGVGSYLVGKAAHLKIRGNKNEVNALAAALASSKRFQDELRKPNATADSVIRKLGLKNASASQFERITGVPWPF